MTRMTMARKKFTRMMVSVDVINSVTNTSPVPGRLNRPLSISCQSSVNRLSTCGDRSHFVGQHHSCELHVLVWQGQAAGEKRKKALRKLVLPREHIFQHFRHISCAVPAHLAFEASSFAITPKNRIEPNQSSVSVGHI